MSYVRVVVDSPTDHPFTYRLTPETLIAANPGTLVEVPVGPTTKYGIVLDRVRSVPAELKDKLRPLGRTLSAGTWAPNATLRLAARLAKYSGEAIGTCLFRLLPPAGKRNLHSVRPPKTRVDGRVFTLTANHERRAKYAIELAQRAQDHGRQTLIIAPLARHVWFERLATQAGLRVHSVSAELSPSVQRRIAHDAASGLVDVLIGTRHIVGWPLHALGLTVVDDPLHQSHIDDQRPYLDSSTIAVLRAQTEGGNLLFGMTISIPAFSVHEHQGTYRRIAAEMPARNITFVRPAMRGRFAPTLLEEIRTSIAAERPVTLVAPRHGLGGIVRCQDCDHVLSCSHCHDELQAKSAATPLACPSCSHQEAWPSTCPSCKGAQLQITGIGTESIERWFLRNEPELRQQLLHVVTEGVFDIPGPRGFVAFLSADSPLASPDLLRPFRYLGAVREAMQTATHVMVETNHAEDHWFALVGAAHERGMAAILDERRKHDLPPFSRTLRAIGPADAALPDEWPITPDRTERTAERMQLEFHLSPATYHEQRRALQKLLGKQWRFHVDSVTEQSLESGVV